MQPQVVPGCRARAVTCCATAFSEGFCGIRCCCDKIADAEAAVSVNVKKWLVMHMHVQLKLDELWHEVMWLASQWCTAHAHSLLPLLCVPI
jgi:hypothetical protein